MTPEELRAATPTAEAVHYLNTGAGGPCPEPVIEACTERVRYHATTAPATEGTYEAMWADLEAGRERVAEHVGATPDELCLTDSTADAIARLATALPLEAGDVVVRTDLEHPAGILPWRRLEDTAGIEVRVVPTEDGRLDMTALTAALDGADLLCLSSITWTHGTRLRVGEAVERAHEAGALALVDAVQSVGQTAVDVAEWNADFVAAASHKWLLGPWGAGVLYVDTDATEVLDPRVLGYDGVTDPTAEDYTFAPGARRLETGSRSPVPFAGVVAAIDTIEAVGFDTIEAHIERLTDRLKAGLGDRLVSPAHYESGLVTFTADDPAATVERLDDAGVKVRALPFPEGTVRASVHAFNDENDVDALLAAL
jgi:selenocysteine lyase/cysteine desulfurase